MSTSRKKPKADANPAGSLSNHEVTDIKEKDEAPITLVLKWPKQTQFKVLNREKSLQSWFNKRKTGISGSVVKILENKNAQINIEPSAASEVLQILSGVNLTLGDGTTVTVESVILGSSKKDTQADKASMTPTPSKSDGEGIRQNQEEAVPVPVGFFWYLSQVYKEEIKRIEKENGCEMEVNLNVTFKAKQKDGSQQNALSEFTNLVQNHLNESRESVIPVQNVRPEQCSEAFKLIQKNEKKVLLTLTPKEITVRGPDSPQLKSVLERNAPDEKPDLLHDDPPLKMTIKDPLADSGMKMEERTWKALDVDGKITQIKEKFDVDFQEVRRDGGKVQVKASYKGPERNPFMESNAVRALLRLYQKSVTSPWNFTKLQGASGFMDWTNMHEDESGKRSVPEGGATGGDSAQLKSVLERNGPDEKPYLLHDYPPQKMTIKDPLADEGMKMEERTWKALKNDGTITKIKEKFEAEFDVKFQEVRRDGVRVQVKASYKGPEGNPFMDSNAVSALLSLYEKSVTSPLNFTQLQGAPSFMDWTTMHEDESEKRPVSEGGATGGDSTEENCPICLSPFRDKKSLNCKHEFCKRCLQKAEENYGPICPVCRKVFGIIQGDQPDGRMTWTRSSGQVPGFSNCGIITIIYSIPDGRQTEKHPKPGHCYTGTTKTAYIPGNKEGNEVLKLLKKAFDQKLIFTIMASNITGFKTRVTWNDIHHKTSLYGGPDSYGYPDPTYLSRVKEELKAKGIE
ncbi:uncharacterized protein LOC144992210 [Oryzias latipes]